MRIFDVKGNEMKTPDLKKGYLKKDSLFVAHHEATEAIEEQGHWVTVKEYPNGGKDVDWIVDVPGVEAKEAWDEYENIQRYVEYSPEELSEMEAARNKPTIEERLDKLEAAINLLLERFDRG